MASGNFQSNTGVNCNIRVEWTSTSNVSANTSTVNVKVYLVHNALYVGSKTLNINCLGSTYSATTPAINTSASGNKTLLADKSFTIAHGSDGTKSGTISATINGFDVTYGGKYIGNLTTSGTATLDTIPRASQPTVSASSVNMGSAITISTHPASSTFTHTLTYKFGNASGTIGTSVMSQTSWTVPLTLANQIPSSTQGTCTITCKTYQGSTLIGTKTVTFTAKVPDSVVPTISTVATSDPNGYLSTYAAYVQGRSKVTAVATAAGAYSSTIKSYKIEMNGSTYYSNGSTSDVLTKSGSNTIKATVTDSRGRTATKSVTITVLEYAAPKITSFKAYRCNSASDTTANEDGAFVYVSHAESISSLSSKNTKTVAVQYKEADASTWTTLSGTTFAANIDKRYIVKLTVTDRIGSTTAAQKEVSSSYTIIDFDKNGKGIAFGKVAEGDEFDVNMDAIFRKAVKGVADLGAGSDITSGYIKFPSDKVIIQWKMVEYTGAVNTAHGNLFINSAAISLGDWIVPMASRFTVQVHIYGQSQASVCWWQQYTASTTTSAGNGRITKAAASATSIKYRILALAIGTYA